MLVTAGLPRPRALPRILNTALRDTDALAISNISEIQQFYINISDNLVDGDRWHDCLHWENSSSSPEAKKTLTPIRRLGPRTFNSGFLRL